MEKLKLDGSMEIGLKNDGSLFMKNKNTKELEVEVVIEGKLEIIPYGEYRALVILGLYTEKTGLVHGITLDNHITNLGISEVSSAPGLLCINIREIDQLSKHGSIFVIWENK